MALQTKSISANGSNGYHKFTLTVTEDSTSISGNSSSVSWKFVLSPVKKNYDWVYTNTVPVTYTVTINGTKYSGNIMKYDGTSTVTIKSGSTTVGHNSDGTKSMSYSFSVSSISASYLPGSASTSGSMTLTKIPRYANITQHYVSSVGTSSITVYWNADASCDAVQCSLNGGGWFSVSGYPQYTVTGLGANTQYSIRTRVRRTDSQLWTESGTIYGTTYPNTVPTISLYSKSVNHITVSSGCNVSVSATHYRIAVSGGSYGSWQTSNSFSGLSPNTTYVIQVEKVGSASGEYGYASLTVATYPVATISSAPNFNLGDSETITYSNPSGCTMNIAIYELINDTFGVVVCNYRQASGSSYTFSLNDTENDVLYKLFKNSNTANVRVYLRTECNGVNYYDYRNITVTLTGNQKTAHVGVNGVQKRAKVYLGANGYVKRAVMWIGNNGRKRCI